eukprot:Partr_v1_DN28590_c0_g1_i1_m73035 putative Paired AMPhipathic helix protein
MQQPVIPQMDQMGGAAGYRPLNVRDALTYLEDVKEQFRNDPNVYHNFLDVMKEFKMNEYAFFSLFDESTLILIPRISTPGVIQRVSTLFRGHPNLIVGFNTFLPPGYRIEGNGDHGASYTLTTPDESLQINHGYQPSNNSPLPQMGANPPVQQPQQQAHPSLINQHQAAHDYQQPPQSGPAYAGHDVQQAQAMQQQHQAAMAHQQQQNPQQQRAPVEFNHAISYVNKIKVCHIWILVVFLTLLERTVM